MRVFSGGIATETNTFAPMPTGLASFRDRGYFPAGKHPDHFNFFAGPLWAARLRGKDRGWDLREGMIAAAQPSGTTTRAAYEELRAELLADLAESEALAERVQVRGDGEPVAPGDLVIAHLAGSGWRIVVAALSPSPKFGAGA